MPRTFRKNGFSIGIALIFMLSLFLPACSRNSGQTQDQVEAPTPTLAPSPIPAADRVVLVQPANVDPNLAAQAESLLRELAAGSGLEFEIRENLINNEVTPDMKVVVFLERPENLGSLAASAPFTQFVAVSSEEWNPTSNVTVIRMRDENTAFMAGYLAAILAPNFRVGALLADNESNFNLAFVNGVYFYCGNCASQIYPLNKYPIVATRPAGSPASEWEAAFNEINASKVNVLYISNAAASPELFTYLSDKDVALIGSQSPPEEGRSRWVVTVFADSISPLRDVWPDLMAGNGGKVLNATINIADNMYVSVQDGLVWLSEGKYNYALRTMDMLRDNKIDPLPVN